MHADFEKVREIFLGIVDEPAAQWDALIDKACGNDPDLRQQVALLLETHAAGEGILDRDFAETASTRFPEPSTEHLGTVIGPYKLLQQIGEGGMGTVFMAEQLHPVQRKVALKVINPGMDSRQIIARFGAERQALALMDHPNIAKVLDAGTTERGRPYFVMELVKGAPITKYCDEHQLKPRERLELFLPVCQAVQHAHQKGIIHRDLKPSNVMVCIYDGKPVPKVIDFGVAKATGPSLTDRTLCTEFGAIVGTLEYMSPEQAVLDQLDVDTRSDIYSLGVLLYELLTGTTPLDRERMKEVAILELLRLVREEEAPRPSTRLSSAARLPSIAANRATEPKKLSGLLRGELDWIMLKALEKDRNRRYDTANAFAADVLHYLHDESVLACPPSVGYRLRKVASRNKRSLATVSLLALALLTGTVISGWQAIRATEAEGLAQTRLQAETEARNATSDQLRLTQQAEDTATQRLYHSLVAQARAGRLSRRMGQRFESLKTLAEAAKMACDMSLPEKDFLNLRNEAIACLALPDLRVAKEWDGLPNGSRRVDFAGTLERYARVDRNGAVSVRRVADDTEICHLAGTGQGESWVSLSPDGKFLARSRRTALDLWNLTGPEPVLVLEGQHTMFAFSPDSRQCVRSLQDGSLCVHELPSGRRIKQLAGGPHVMGGLAFHPKDRQLAVGHATGVQIRDLETGCVLAELAQPLQPHGGLCVAWQPDGKSLAVVGNERIIHIWDVATCKSIAQLVGHNSYGIGCAFNHAGDLLASMSWDGTLRLWDPRSGQQLFQTQAWVECPRFSPDDRLLAAGIDGPKLRLWEVISAVGYRALARGPGHGKREYFTSTISSDGRLLATGTRNGTDLWDLGAGTHLAAIPSDPGMSHVLFEPSGALLINVPGGPSHCWPEATRSMPGPRTIMASLATCCWRHLPSS